MSLTVKDILEKTFKRSFKGYDENEVDKFLDQIIDELKALQNDNAALKEALDAEIARAKKIKETEETIMHTLVSAQKSAERIINEAAKKAELIIDNAENTAKLRSEQTTRELAEAQKKLAEVKEYAKNFAVNFTEMINREAASFEKIYREYFGEIEGGINVKALEKIDEDITQSLKGISPEEPEEEPEAPEAQAPAAEPEAETPERLLEFTEINKALSEIENGGEDILQDRYEEVPEIKADDSGEPDDYKPKYDDYSWLYGSDNTDDTGVSFKDPKEKEEFESLLDDIVE